MSIVIASLYWESVTHEKDLLTPVNRWTLPAVARGAQPATIEVDNQQQWDVVPIVHRQKADTIFASEIANDCIRAWTTGGPGMSPQCRPAIWVCEGAVPTELEISVNLAAQRAWAEQLIMKGHAIFADPAARSLPSGRGGISQLMRNAARWMGLSPEWLPEIRTSEVKTCVLCTKPIPAAALLCPECGGVADPAGFAKQQRILQDAMAAEGVGAVAPPPPSAIPQVRIPAPRV